ncbi:uncharacterized protein EV420DRAFT_1270016 [Desarmillaria tabescens]|uniref:Heterokaryon incompatibility domain-containing protein n=1 Tax=Armillaria tabescens TaxID=1929756 RepID=A0AA39KHC7_ARMTA|nr:uncharacterized protein EV420DRAFT_1270016 [Desarmillaria tabescens]KAK0458878.1 hypothetical protein EV420DRAFT_1270016 [Desarmillaria tabescens]
MAYGRLRQLWYINDWSNIRDRFHRWEEEDQEMRRKALVSNQIINPKLPPRRVWDLFSNRVVPWWCTGISCNEWYRSHQLWPISHAWMDEKDRVNVQTPINEYKWPVPIPKDTSLNLVRIEMLNLGAQYAWLDVLCLRQVGGPGEHMRKEEWKLDVPTIGTVYHLADVVIYMSGLGRPLSLKDGDLDSDRCWFRRAWTLQEVGEDRVIAGDTPDGPMHAECKDGKYETPPLTRFHEQLESMDHILYGAFAALEDMQNRVSTNPVDKVAGLAFCQLSKTIPAYYESESLEGAWTALMNSMDEWRRGLLFLYPEPGSAGRKWRPSWDQLMTKPLPAGGYLGIKVNRDEMDEDWCDAECIEKGFVRWLTAVEEGDRRGQLIVNDKGGTEHAFNITAAHEYPIPEDMYALICGVSPSQYWVVGRRLPEERFEKVSVFQMSLKELNRFRDLHITEECRNILV